MRQPRREAIPPTLKGLSPPSSVIGRPNLHSELALREWEDALIVFLASAGDHLSPWPDYFRLRANEFRVLRGLLTDLFRLDQPHNLLLEIGCGFGFKSTLLAPFAHQVIGVDIPEMYPSHTVGGFPNSVAVAKALVNDVLRRDDIRFETAWPHELPLEDGSLDLIYSEYVLEHVEDLSPTVQEFKRVLRPGGFMVHVVPNPLDALVELARVNLRVPWRSVAAGTLGRLLRRSGKRPRLTARGTIVPVPHSEFLDDFADQIGVYALDSYLIPMMEAGFQVHEITTIRGINNVLVVESLEHGVAGK